MSSVNLEAFLNFVMKHNTIIIEALIGCTLVITLVLAIRSFLSAKDGPAEGSALGASGDIEALLKKLLDQAAQVPTAGAVAAAGASEESQKLVAEISQLKSELETRQKTIEELKASGSGAGATAAAAPAAGGMSDEEKAKLEAQLKELQGKLAEYEIISEDIADLSFYKEQNAKLTKELEALKGGAGTTATPAAAPTAAVVPAAAPAKPKEEPAIVGKSKVSEPEPATVSTPEPMSAPVASPAPASEPVVATPTAPTPAPAAPAAAATPPQPVTPAAPVTAPAVPAMPEAAPAAEVNNVIDKDLMAEFDAAVEKQQTSAATEGSETPAKSEAGVDLGAMDVDKMMAEAAAIKHEGPEVSAEQALGVGLDENKLLQEATALESVSPEDKKLMGQFENFVKKGE